MAALEDSIPYGRGVFTFCVSVVDSHECSALSNAAVSADASAQHRLVSAHQRGAASVRRHSGCVGVWPDAALF